MAIDQITNGESKAIKLKIKNSFINLWKQHTELLPGNIAYENQLESLTKYIDDQLRSVNDESHPVSNSSSEAANMGLDARMYTAIDNIASTYGYAISDKSAWKMQMNKFIVDEANNNTKSDYNGATGPTAKDYMLWDIDARLQRGEIDNYAKSYITTAINFGSPKSVDALLADYNAFQASDNGDLDHDGSINSIDYDDYDVNVQNKPVSSAPTDTRTEAQKLADNAKTFNTWMAEAAGGNPTHLRTFDDFVLKLAGKPVLSDDYYKPQNGFIFIRGDGPKDKPATELKGNGNAVFAVDKNGNMFHVSEDILKQMETSGQKPFIREGGSQAVIDQMGVDGTFISPTEPKLYAQTTSAPAPDPVTPSPVIVTPTPTPAPPDNGGSATPAPTDPNNGNSSNNSGEGTALTTYSRDTRDSTYTYPWSAAKASGSTDIISTISKAVTFMNAHEGTDFHYNKAKGTISSGDGSVISKDDIQALNNIIVKYSKQNFEGVDIPSGVGSNHTSNTNFAGTESVLTQKEGRGLRQTTGLGAERIQDSTTGMYGVTGGGVVPQTVTKPTDSTIPIPGGN